MNCHVGLYTNYPHDLVESFKSTLDEVRDSDLLIHVVDISHPDFEDHIRVVRQTLAEIDANDKPTIMLFNKIDAYTFIKKEEDDLTPSTKENLSLEDLKKTWMASLEFPTLFISATKKENIAELRKTIYEAVKKVHIKRYPYNNFLFEYPEQL